MKMVAFLLALIILMPTLIALPILRALEKGIARKNLIFILCSLFFPAGLFFSYILNVSGLFDIFFLFPNWIDFIMVYGSFPLWIISIMIVKYSKSNPEIASKNMRAHKIIRLLVPLITILILSLIGYKIYWVFSPVYSDCLLCH